MKQNKVQIYEMLPSTTLKSMVVSIFSHASTFFLRLQVMYSKLKSHSVPSFSVYECLGFLFLTPSRMSWRSFLVKARRCQSASLRKLSPPGHLYDQRCDLEFCSSSKLKNVLTSSAAMISSSMLSEILRCQCIWILSYIADF
jgi:hypothetical protein